MKLKASQAGTHSGYDERTDHGRRFPDGDDDVRITRPNELVRQLRIERGGICEHDDVEPLLGGRRGRAGARADPVNRGVCRLRSAGARVGEGWPGWTTISRSAGRGIFNDEMADPGRGEQRGGRSTDATPAKQPDGGTLPSR